MQKNNERKSKWIKEGKKEGRKIGYDKGYQKGYDEGYAEGRTQVVREILKKIKAKKTNKELAFSLGVDPSEINNWLNGNVKRASTVERIIGSIVKSAKRQAISNSYSAIPELKHLKGILSKRGGKYDMRIGDDEKECKEIEKELKKEFGGIYIFYDSLGKAIYAGKTERKDRKNGKLYNNSLWDEMKSAYNRKRPNAQTIVKCTKGILSKQNYFLYETACYVSAYKVDELAIRDFEALIIRSFPNDLTNVRMETKGEKEVLSFDDDV